MRREFRPAWLVLAFALVGCGGNAALTTFSAGELAARLANDACQARYGERPFRADDYEAVLQEGRWYWGSDNGGHVDGYLVHVSFDPRGKRRDLRLAGRDAPDPEE